MTRSDTSQYGVRLAASPAEVKAALRLRHDVFVKEWGATTDPKADALGLERDDFDAFADHLLLICTQDGAEQVVGTYRLMLPEQAKAAGGFYGAREFDLAPILGGSRSVLEVGRSCVDRAHRNGVAMHLLWSGLADYVTAREISLIFGVASFPGCDAADYAHALSYLGYNHLAPNDICVTARGSDTVALTQLPRASVDKARALRELPSLIKGYLRLGGYVGRDAYVDRAFNALDICLIMDTDRMVAKYRDRYAGGLAA